MEALKTSVAISPKAMEEKLYQFSLTAFQTKAFANIIAQQESLQIVNDPTNILAKAGKLQETSIARAEFYNTVGSTGVINVLTALDRAVNIATALSSALKGSSDTATSQAVCISCANAFYDIEQEINRISGRTRQYLTGAKDASVLFSTELNRLEEVLDGPSGQIAAASEAINKTLENIDVAIERLAQNSKDIGAGVKQLATFVLTIFTSSKSQNKQDSSGEKSESEKKTGTSGGTEAGEQDAFGNIEPFPVNSIDSIEDGAKENVAIVNALKAENKRLETLYHSQSSLSAALGVCQVILAQEARFVDHYSKTSSALDALQAEFSKLARDYKQVSEDISSTSFGDEEYTGLIENLHFTGRAWLFVREDLAEIEKGFAGISLAFPPA